MNYLISKLFRLVTISVLLVSASFSANADDKYHKDIQMLYIAYFGRPADPRGLANFKAALNAGEVDVKVESLSTNAVFKNLIDSLGSSAEAASLVTNLSQIEQIQATYERLFSRKAQIHEVLYWNNAVTSGGIRLNELPLVLALNASGNDQIVLNSKINAAILFTDNINTTQKLIGYTGAEGGKVGRDYISNIYSSESFPSESKLNSSINLLLNSNNISVNDNTTLTGTSSTVSSFGNISSPAAAAIAYGDGGYPTFSENLLSHQTSSQGGLVSYNLTGGMDAGTGGQATSCAISSCSEPNIIRWGTWSSGTVTISTQNVMPSSSNLVHYIVGNATPTAALTGTATYAMIGQTTPTSTTGTSYSAAIGNISVNFSNSSAALTSYALSGNNVNTSDFTFTNVPLTLSNSSNSNSLVISGSQMNSANSQISLNGFFAGATGKYIGAAIKATDSNGTWAVNQVAAFKK